MREQYTTPSGIVVARTLSKIPYQKGLAAVLRRLDKQRGIYLSSGYEYPGRYSRWDVAAAAPPLEIIAAGREVVFRALSERGKNLLKILRPVLEPHPHWSRFAAEEDSINGTLKPLGELFSEEERSKQPSAFSMLRALLAEFQHPLASRLGLVGAFGYDLVLQFDPIELKLPRSGVKDLHLLWCDEIYFMDRKKEAIERYQFDFTSGDVSTVGMARTSGRLSKPRKRKPGPIVSDHTEAEYVAGVEKVRDRMRQGDYYEVTGDGTASIYWLPRN